MSWGRPESTCRDFPWTSDQDVPQTSFQDVFRTSDCDVPGTSVQDVPQMVKQDLQGTLLGDVLGMPWEPIFAGWEYRWGWVRQLTWGYDWGGGYGQGGTYGWRHLWKVWMGISKMPQFLKWVVRLTEKGRFRNEGIQYPLPTMMHSGRQSVSG